MRLSKSKSFIGLYGLVLLLIVFLVTQNVFINITEENHHTKDYYGNLKRSIPWDKIHIVGNQGWVDFRTDGNCTGSGTYLDPYLIEDLEIELTDYYSSGIIIENSDVYFIIENCTIFHHSVCDTGTKGIKLKNVLNGEIINNFLNNSGDLIYLENSHNNSIAGNDLTITPNYVIYLDNSHNNTIYKNQIHVSTVAIGLYYSNNTNIQENLIETSGISIFGSHNSIINNNLTAIGGSNVMIYEGSNNSVFYNYIKIGAYDDGINNRWNDGFAGNYWVAYIGNDNNPKDGIGDSPFDIDLDTQDTKPLVYLTWEDSDGDNLINLEEYTLGKDGYRTNVITADSDNDNLNDYWEWLNGTNPWNNDTDYDLISDIDEITGALGYITNATNPDTDNDRLRDDYEYGNNTLPLNPDTDGDTLLDGDEILGTLGYVTNATNPDTDNDRLRDDYEYGNNTNPLLPDTDFDSIDDIDEILGTLGYVTNATDPDTDNDNLRDDYEYGNNTNPLLPDTDFDSFNDDVELNFGTNPTKAYWYPMPNLIISNFTVSNIYEGKPFVLDFTITNNGIWTAESIIIIIRCERLDITLYNNTNSPFNLYVDESKHIIADCYEISKPGVYALTLIIDPNNLINETYSSKDGSFRLDGEKDNSEQIQMEIIAKEGGTSPFNFELLLWILVPIIAGITIIITGIAIKKKHEKGKILRKRESNVWEDLDEFEQKIRMFIRNQLKDYYKEAWWEKGIPQYIKDAVEPKLKEKLLKNPELSLDGIDLLNFDHYFLIISEKHNWDKLFSKTFSLVKNIEEPFENLKLFKNRFNQKQANMRDFAKYAMFIYAIEKYFMKEINIFLSYSTLDAEHFKISEISKSLERYPGINKIFFWEADSGEDIVDYMERTLQLSKTFILFCSENSIKSQSVEDEWKAAFQLRKKGLMKLIPVYEDERFIPALLTPLLNVKFERDNFDEFVEKLYKEIIRS